jgi:hypothetical protein
VAAKTCSIAAALLVAGCSQVLGFKDPRLEDAQPVIDDAAVDARADAPADARTDAPPDTGPAACMPSACPFGCDPDTNACRPAKLWVFLTIGAFFANGFGGADVPPDVRATADARCFDTFSQSFAARACTKARTHAILTVSGGDSIQVMASTYGIPTTVEVHRADDDLLVFDSWNALTDPTKAPRAPVASHTSASSDADGTAWTGFVPSGSSNCLGWTSKATADSGELAHTTTDSGSAPGVLWLGQGSVSCNLQLQRLLCVCWSGGN